MTISSDDLNSIALELFERSLDIPSKDRENWIKEQAGSHDQLRDKALNYLLRDANAGVAFHTGGAFHDTLDDTAIPDFIGAYKITGLIGRGGMGAVYQGKRASGDFDHDVAIKVVRPGVLSDKLVARFANERQTLAKLSHPNIARLYDGGKLDNGAPYIVMEFVDGLPITEWAENLNSSKEDRLTLFEAVCAAVSYAHQNLVIHRDVTPSNVLVDNAGQVKLIDFGIAKPFDEDGAVLDVVNSLASMSFTAGYAAPERSKGAGANTLSDIYSLGKLLGALIDTHAKDPDLSAIIDKAAALEPTDRYSSVDSLIDDVKNYRTGYPVDARNAGKGYQFWKYLGRQKLVVALATLVATGLIGGLIITSNLYKQAETALQFADQRFSETRGLTEYLLNDLAEELQSLPGTLDIQNNLRETSTEYLDILAKASQTDKTVLLDYAVAERRMGELLTQAGGFNLGDPEKAFKHFQISLDILNELKDSPEANEDVYFALAKAEFDYGYSLGYHQGKDEEGLPYLKRSVSYFDKAIDLNPDMEDAWLRRAISKLSLFYTAGDNWAESQDTLDELKKEYQTIQKKFPDSKGLKPYLTTFLRASANYKLDYWVDYQDEHVSLTDKEAFESALEDIKISKALASELIADSPTDPEHIYQYVWSQEIEALLYGLDLEWHPTFEETAGILAEIREKDGLSGVKTAITTDPRFEWRRKAAKFVNPGLDMSDNYLKRLEPYDGTSYAHVEAIYYNYWARAYIEGQLNFDYAASVENLNRAITLAKTFPEKYPAQSLDILEISNAHLGIARVSLARQHVEGRSYANEICSSLSEANRTLKHYEAKYGSSADYEAYIEYYNGIKTEQDC